MKRSMTLLAVVSVLALVQMVNASITLPPITTSTPIPLTLTDFTGQLAFPKFTPGPGQSLESVELTLNGSITTTITATNYGTSSSSGAARTEVQFTVMDPAGQFSDPWLDLFSPLFKYTNLPAGLSATSGTLTKTGSDTVTYTDPAVLTEFTGSGNILLDISTFTQTWLNNSGGNTAASQLTNGSLTGQVVYTFVPEPATLSLVGFSLVSLFVRRRRHSA